MGVHAARALAGWAVLAADRAEPARFGSRAAAVTAREAAAGAVFSVLSPFGWRGWGEAPRPVRPRVVLVPDPGYNRSVFTFLRTYLERRGLVVWSLDPAQGDLSLAEHAAALAKALASCPEPVDVVAHGRGGLIAAWCAKHAGGESRIARLVTLGAPWGGTRMSAFSHGRLAEETRHGAPLLGSLLPCPVPVVAVWSPDDPWVVPSLSAAPEGSESVRIDGCGHLDWLASAFAFRAVLAALRKGS